MGKQKTRSKLTAQQTSATAKFVHVPPRKARFVMDAVRGRYVSDALATLKFVPNFAARAIEKVINSAVANAEHGRPVSGETGRALPPLVVENLKLHDARVDDGPRLKRVQPRAQGRAYRILKRTCHISVVLEEVEPKPRADRTQVAARRARQAGRTVPATARAPKAQSTPADTSAPAAETTPGTTE